MRNKMNIDMIMYNLWHLPASNEVTTVTHRRNREMSEYWYDYN